MGKTGKMQRMAKARKTKRRVMRSRLDALRKKYSDFRDYEDEMAGLVYDFGLVGVDWTTERIETIYHLAKHARSNPTLKNLLGVLRYN